MSTIIMLCGKVCAGKSFYSRKLCEKQKIVTLSVDELMLSLFPERLGDEHNSVADRCKAFLLSQAEDIAAAGADVLLDFGFWFKEERVKTRARFEALGHSVKLVFIDASDERIRANAQRRNLKKSSGEELYCYETDEALLKKCSELFEYPSADECDEIIQL